MKTIKGHVTLNMLNPLHYCRTYKQFVSLWLCAGASRTSSGGDTTDHSSGDTGSNPSKSMRISSALSPAATAKLNAAHNVTNSSSPSKSFKRGEAT